MPLNKTASVDEYIASFPNDVQSKLKQMRSVITSVAPEVIEKISWMMPAYSLYGRDLVYFAAFKKHIGLYAAPSAKLQFSDKLGKYKTGKGSIQFPLTEELPIDIIKELIEFRVAENLAKAHK